MKRAVVFALGVLFFSISVASAQNTGPAFEMSDGYFTVPGAQPIHLIHALKEYTVRRGDDVDTHLDIKLKGGIESPCSSKNEERCKFLMQFVEKDNSGKEVIVSTTGIVQDFGDSANVGFGDSVPRKISGDKAVYRLLITKATEEYFRLDIPLRVR